MILRWITLYYMVHAEASRVSHLVYQEYTLSWYIMEASQAPTTVSFCEFIITIVTRLQREQYTIRHIQIYLPFEQ